MKITSVEPVSIDRFLFVQVHTDAGISGLGESGAWGHLEASEAALKKFGRYLEGENPFRIEHHWNVMYRSGHFRGAAIMSAISAIDIALWDIKGKALGVPVYELLGGKTRDCARVYNDWAAEFAASHTLLHCFDAGRQAADDYLRAATSVLTALQFCPVFNGSRQHETGQSEGCVVFPY